MSCFSRPFCRAGATSAGVLPLRISWVVRAELEKKNAYLKTIQFKDERVSFFLLTIVNCPNCCSVNSCRYNTLMVHILDPKGCFCRWEDWVGVWVTWFHDYTCHANARVFWHKYCPCGFTFAPNHFAQCPISGVGIT